LTFVGNEMRGGRPRYNHTLVLSRSLAHNVQYSHRVLDLFLEQFLEPSRTVLCLASHEAHNPPTRLPAHTHDPRRSSTCCTPCHHALPDHPPYCVLHNRAVRVHCQRPRGWQCCCARHSESLCSCVAHITSGVQRRPRGLFATTTSSSSTNHRCRVSSRIIAAPSMLPAAAWLLLVCATSWQAPSAHKGWMQRQNQASGTLCAAHKLFSLAASARPLVECAHSHTPRTILVALRRGQLAVCSQ